jgi:hypothetical protein
MNCGQNTLLNMLFYLLSNKNYNYTNKNNEIGIQKEIHEYMLKNNYTTFEINKEQSYFGKLLPDLDMKLNKQKNKELYARQCANNTMGCEIIPTFKNFIYIFENIIIPNIQNDEEYIKINTDNDKFTYIISKFNKDIKIRISGDINNITIKLEHFVNISFNLKPSHGTTHLINNFFSKINIYIQLDLAPNAYENSLENELMVDHKLKTSSGKIIDRKHYKPQYFDKISFNIYQRLKSIKIIEYLTQNKIIALYIDFDMWKDIFSQLISKQNSVPENNKILVKAIVENIKELNNELYKELPSTELDNFQELIDFISYYSVYDIEILENNFQLINLNLKQLPTLYNIYKDLKKLDILFEFLINIFSNNIRWEMLALQVDNDFFKKNIIEPIKKDSNKLQKIINSKYRKIIYLVSTIKNFELSDISLLENNIELIKNNINELPKLYIHYKKFKAQDIFVEFIKKNNIEFNIPNTQQKYKNKYIKYKMKYLALKNNI